MTKKKPQYTNRLINEKSPYLLQHAHNPVDWYPWGEEAFAAARANDKPIFLSIGYATCHWCHVMERESFENVGIAKLMNETFINIKVDREELPEVDTLYMEFAQTMMAGAAGWPLNVILTPELQPFFASTYLPADNRQGLIGLRDLIIRIRNIWYSEEREKVAEQAERIVAILTEHQKILGTEIPPQDVVENSIELLFQLADPTYGGLKGVPKFPIGYHINFLLAYSAKTQDSRALFLAEKTLDKMHQGGIYDHLGGGFSRYSVDEKWLVPHFEKMLYDNAILAHCYCRAWQSSQIPEYLKVSQNILDYILRDMTHAEGGFFSAEDSETEGKEGLFYTWTMDELRDLLSPEDLELFCNFYHVTTMGNFENRNVLSTPLSLDEFANQHQVSKEELDSRLQKIRQQLWQVREQRPHPFKDDKILSSWNGLMIHAMAIAGSAMGEQRYIEGAVNAARFIKMHLWKEGHLFRRWRESDVQYTGGLDEYASMIRACLSLFEAGAGSEWLKWAMEMTEILAAEFKEEGGAFYQTDGKDPSIIIRKFQFSDGAEPSGNAMHCENLIRLHQITHYEKYLQQAEDILKVVKNHLDTYPPGYIYHVMNIHRYYDQDALTFVISLNQEEEHREQIAHLLNSRYLPHRVIVWRKEDDSDLFDLVPALQTQHCQEGKTTLCICKQGVCQVPIHEINQIKEAIEKL